MEKKEPINGYEKYSEWFETIERMCDEAHFIGILSAQDTSYPYYQHYILDNGLHVLKKGGDIIISDEEIHKGDLLGRLRQRRMKKSETDRKRISLETGKNARISYGPEGTTATAVASGKDYSFLPPNIEDGFQKQYEITGDLPIDMRQLLSEAMDRAEDEETRKMYEKAIGLYDKISTAIELHQAQEYGESGDSSAPDGLAREEKNVLSAKDPTPDELEQMPIKDLENLLRSTEMANGEKRKELEGLKKKDLIAQIKKAIEAGKELDAEIADARANDRTDSGENR